MVLDTRDTIRSCPALFLLAILVFTIYANSLNASWQMDDKPNILDNRDLHIDNLMPETLFKTFFAHPGSAQKLYRPLVCLTLALNWYSGKDDPTGYHWVNIIIHIMGAFVLYSLTASLFSTPALTGKYTPKEIHFISLLSAVLWAVNPIQTQAVTYIVQRMTAMAALFYLLSLFFYIRARLTEVPLSKNCYFVGCLLAFLCGLGSKENAALLPVAILVVEIAFFRLSFRTCFEKTPNNIFLGIGFLGFIVLFIFYSKGDPFFFLKGYDHRSFSFSERILTQPRILLFYLSLIFYPLPQRLSIDHDFVLSTSLFSPWPTFPSIILVLMLIISGITLLRKYPLAAFAVTFFFLNHLIESTVIPLEMVFEHRNYLPSAFLFLPVVVLLHTGIRYYRNRSRLISTAVIAFSVFLLINLGMGTHIRNMAWASKKSLWEDAAKKAPGNARPLVNLAIELGWKKNPTRKELSEAVFLLQKALSLAKPNKFHQADVYGNIAGIYYRAKEYEKAVSYYNKALFIDPLFIKNRYNLAQALVLLHRLEDASKHLDFILKNTAAKYAKYPNLKGFILLWQNRYEEALPFFREALSLSPNESSVLLNTGVTLSHLQSIKNAEWFLLRAAKTSPEDMMPYCYLIENALRANDFKQAHHYSKLLLSRHSFLSVQEFLDAPGNNLVFPPIDKNQISKIIKETAKNIL